MNKQEFFNDLQEIITDIVYIAPKVEDIDEEIMNNSWSISVTQELCKELKEDDLRTFFDSVINNRREQVKNSKYNHGMIFYLWFEQQSGRLRFNLISDFHEKLPFGCELLEVNNIEDIIIEFLKYEYHDGIPVIENEDDSIQPITEDNVCTLKIFIKVLPK
jgi:hypothetical protein